MLLRRTRRESRDEDDEHPALRHCAIALALALLATTSHAHPEAEAAAGLVPGLLHPLTGLDHLLAMLALGMWAAVLGRRMVRALPLAFPLLMAAGAAREWTELVQTGS